MITCGEDSVWTKNNLGIRNGDKLQILQKREFPTRQGCWKSFPWQRISFVTSLMSALLSYSAKTGRNDFNARYLWWSNMVKCGDRFRTDLYGGFPMEAVTAAHVIVRDNGRLLRGKSFIYPFFPWAKGCSAREWLPKPWWTGVITWFTVIPALSFYTPTHLLPKAPQWNNCQDLQLTTSQNTQLR
jgi:hypothetical protein